MSATRAALILAGGLLFLPPAGAEDQTAQRQFDALVREIGDLRDTLDSLQQRERGVLTDLDRCQVESELRARELQQVRLERSQMDQSYRRTQAAVLSGREATRQGEQRLGKQLREIYLMSRASDLGWLVALEEPENAMRGLAYLDALAARQTAALEELRRTRATVESQERNLRDQLAGLGALEQRETARAADLEASRARASDLLVGIRTQQETHKDAIEEMTAAAEQLEAAIVAGTQNESGLPVLDARKLRGAMIWPAEGTVVEGFGDRKHPRFGTTTPHPGVEIEVAPGAAIRAVLAGQVVFARRFPGYGNTVLLDHGGGHMTVYARASVLNVTEGQIVAQEDILGTGGQFGADGGPPTIYFEFREAGKAVDPTIWLKKQSSHRREG